MTPLGELGARADAGTCRSALVATIFNVIRLFALGVSVGLVVRAGTHPAGAGAAR
jgi:hypothetical protein